MRSISTIFILAPLPGVGRQLSVSFVLLLDRGQDRGIGQGGGVAQDLASAMSRSRRRMILALRVLGSSAVKKILSGLAIGADLLRRRGRAARRPSRRRRRSRRAAVTKAAMPWPLISWVMPITAASATAGWLTSARLDLHRADAVAGDVQHVVDAAEQPVVALVVALGAVAGEVAAGEPAPVLLWTSARGRPRSCAPWPARAAAGPGSRRLPSGTALPCSSSTSALIAGNGNVAEPGLSTVMPGQRRDQNLPGLGHPPRVDHRAAVAADLLAVPDPGLRD